MAEPLRRDDHCHLSAASMAPGTRGVMRDTRQPCGTTAAYQRHLKHGETPCKECRAANAEASRIRRAEGRVPPRRDEASRRYQRARQRALRRLELRHPEEFGVLMKIELRRTMERSNGDGQEGQGRGQADEAAGRQQEAPASTRHDDR